LVSCIFDLQIRKIHKNDGDEREERLAENARGCKLYALEVEELPEGMASTILLQKKRCHQCG
jgi:hypothetical protein